MKCRIDKTAVTDIAAWVSKEAFMANIDQDDLACRASVEVFNWYHPDWFSHDENGYPYFTPPAFIFNNGRLRGINGRHRAILLFKHMDFIPMLLVLPHEWPKDKLAEIAKKEIGEDEIIELPDLPINTKINEEMKLDIIEDSVNPPDIIIIE
jgi:hypothetical protein